MTDNDRAALARTIRAGLLTAYRMGCRRESEYDMDEEASRLAAAIEDDFIDRLLAAHGQPRQISVEYACGGQEYWDLEPDGSLRIDIPRDQVVVASDQLAAIRNAVAQAQGRGEGAA